MPARSALNSLIAVRSKLAAKHAVTAARGFSGFSIFLMKETNYTRVLATFFIFLVSLFAVSLPTLSRRVSFLRIPRIVFFIGKHFGTGVILSTAFVHLLQDSFESLRSPSVLARWKIGNYVGLIVLCSLLSIFIVEYVSTSFVHQLQSYGSPPTSATPSPRDESPPDLEHAPTIHKPVPSENFDQERTPLLRESDPHPIIYHEPDSSYGAVHNHDHTRSLVGDASSAFFEGHHRHEFRVSHSAHHERSRPHTMYGSEDFEQAHSDDVGHATLNESSHHHHHHHHHDGFEGGHTHDHSYFHGHDHDHGHEKIKIGKSRQIVGILVLQFGIMIHSLVIGLTLSITSGPDFTTLLIAVIFHQLFEGLSLGIRIASLPSSREHAYVNVLKPVLACLFAITTPAGILLGILLFAHSDDMARLQLTQGIMSAISAGMLMYAACVEMLAGDFVMDPILWQSGIGKQALALLSLAAGVVSMAFVGS